MGRPRGGRPPGSSKQTDSDESNVVSDPPPRTQRHTPAADNDAAESDSHSQLNSTLTQDQGLMLPPTADEFQRSLYQTLLGIKNDTQSIKTDIAGIKSSLSSTAAIANQAMDKSKSNEEKISGVESELADCMHKISHLKLENESLKNQLLYNESQHRRSNLILYGIPEGPNEDCFVLVVQFLINNMKIAAAKDFKIDRCHRKGPRKPRSKQPRPIIFKMNFYQDRETIWKARRKLSGSKYSISEDYPPEIAKRRSVLNPIMKRAIANDKFALLSVDKLIIDNEVYTIDTIHRLPADLQPCEVATRRSSTHTGFFSGASPLSNFHPACFTDDEGNSFVHSEQYYQYNKALSNGDHEKAKHILDCVEPADCHRIGKSVDIPDLEAWKKRAMDVMYTGCKFKFLQNPSLANFLKSTGDTILVEANPQDKIWSSGLRIDDPDLFKPTSWKGSNLLGKVLRKIRDELIVSQSQPSAT